MQVISLLGAGPVAPRMSLRDRTSVRTSRFPISSLVHRILAYSEIIRYPDTLGIVTLCHVSATASFCPLFFALCAAPAEPPLKPAGKWHVTNRVRWRSFTVMQTRRKKNSGPLSSAINEHIKPAEPTITQNGALYQVQHRQPSLPLARILSRLSFKNSTSNRTFECPLAPRLAPIASAESASTN